MLLKWRTPEQSKGHKALRFSENGEEVVVGGQGGTLQFFSTENGSPNGRELDLPAEDPALFVRVLDAELITAVNHLAQLGVGAGVGERGPDPERLLGLRAGQDKPYRDADRA